MVGAAQPAVGRRPDLGTAPPRPRQPDAGTAPGAPGEPVAAHRRRLRDLRRLRAPGRMDRHDRGACAQAGLMITLPLWPPKPKLLEIVGPGSHGRGPPMTTSMPRSTSTVLAVGGIWRCWNDSSTAAASSAPAAPSACPVTPLIDVTGGG